MQKTRFPFELCNRYSSCSVNNCPLDPVYPDRYTDPEDKEQKCGYAKSYRMQIAEQFPNVLKYGGITIREFQNKQRWEALPEEVRQATTERMRAYHANKKQNEATV